MAPDMRPRVLWTDDDGPDRFPYECFRIEQSGWSITWANSVLTAARALAEAPFDAMLLDQMVPYQGLDRGVLVPWGGCLVLRWLRGTYPPARAPLVDVSPEHDLRKITPHPHNRSIRVMIVSAFHDDDVLKEIQAASEMDRGTTISPKTPVDKELLDFLKHSRQERP